MEITFKCTCIHALMKNHYQQPLLVKNQEGLDYVTELKERHQTDQIILLIFGEEEIINYRFKKVSLIWFFQRCMTCSLKEGIRSIVSYDA